MKKVIFPFLLLFCIGLTSLGIVKTDCTIEKPYISSTSLTPVNSTEGNIKRIDYVDEFGNITYASDKQYASIVIIMDNNSSVEAYYDEFGELTKKSNGNYGMLREYDDRENNFRITYLGIDLKPKKNVIGYAINERTFDEIGRIVKERFFNVDGEPVRTSYGAYGRGLIYDDTGACVRITYVGKDGEPLIVKYGYSTVERHMLNNSELVAYEQYFDTEGNPVKLSLGQFGASFNYDDVGRVSCITYLDEEAVPSETIEGYCSVKKTYNGKGSLSIETYYDINGEPVALSHGQYGVKHLNGKTIYLDKNGQEMFDLNNWLHNNPIAVVTIAVFVIILSMFLGKRGNIVLLFFYLAFIVYMTLMYRVEGDTRAEVELFWSYKQFFSSSALRLEILNNIWLFIPLGSILYSLCPRWWIICILVSLSVVIEAVQYFTGLGLAELDDVISNGLGGLIGFGFVYSLEQVVKRLNAQRI